MTTRNVQVGMDKLALMRLHHGFPLGKSGWEFGVGEGLKKKADC